MGNSTSTRRVYRRQTHCCARVRERKLKEKKHKLRWSVEGSRRKKIRWCNFFSYFAYIFFISGTFHKVDSWIWSFQTATNSACEQSETIFFSLAHFFISYRLNFMCTHNVTSSLKNLFILLFLLLWLFSLLATIIHNSWLQLDSFARFHDVNFAPSAYETFFIYLLVSLAEKFKISIHTIFFDVRHVWLVWRPNDFRGEQKILI